MKQWLVRSLMVCALRAALAVPGFAEESRRGFYEGNLAGGGRIVFFVQGNHALSSYVFDTAGHQAYFGGATVNDNGTFTMTTTPAGTVTGTVTPNSVSATVLGQTVTANRVSTFGESEHLGGRFSATATASTGSSFDVKFVIDAQKNIFMIAKQGTTVLGGFGTVTVTASPSPSPSASPSATASPSPTATASPSATASAFAADRGGDDNGDDCDNSGSGNNCSEDEDEREDHHLDANDDSFSGTFTVTFVTGEVVTGHITRSHGLLLGDFTLNGVVFRFRAPQESSENRLANIATRGFVNTGQGQLIGGFIVRGGPKLVLIRALGPSLAASGVSPALADPQLRLFQNTTLLRQNDNWGSAANANEITATTIPPTNAQEAAILIRLEPGNYTTVVDGVNNGTGIALVEVYELDRD
ncbi:MAG: hypothetical protein ACJ8M4_00305 [Chthoniobacterales bacterium]